ncbi:MAG: InlB B-repeat-containing protein [Methanosarcinales archaeon]|jgi:uncharacterized repeat protein (TIGR02543 family)|nr:InlB B-repeat-containing protein [Methanosarcinales archaeon]
MKTNILKTAASLFLLAVVVLSIIPAPALGGETTATVTFYANGRIYNRETVNVGGTVPVPLAPAVPTGMVSFVGWSAELNGIDKLYDFSMPVTGSLNLFAQYSDKHLVSFKDADGDIFYTRLVEADDFVVPPAAPPSGTDDVFAYWAVGSTYDIYDFSLPVNSNIVLRPVYGNSYYIYFNSMRGTPVDDQLIGEDEKAEKPADPTRAGFKFAFWSKTLDANPGNSAAAYDFSATVTESFTLYAIWEPDSANKPEVKVIIWKEKENLPLLFDKTDVNNYVFHDSFVTWALAGTTIAISESEMNQDHSFRIPTHSEFHRSVPAVVEGDGSTAVNVYYTNKIYTLRFNLNHSSAVMKDENGLSPVIYTNSSNPNEQHSIQVKLGMDVEDIWPLNEVNNFSIYRTDGAGFLFQGWMIPFGLNSWYANNNVIFVSKRQVVTAEMLPSSIFGNGSETGYTLNAYWIDDGQNVDLKYMFEALPEEEKTGVPGVDYVEYDGKLYINSTGHSQLAISTGAAFMLKSIEGKTRLTEYALQFNSTTEELEPIIGTGFTQILIYDRNRHSLNFDTMGGSSIAGHTDILFSEPLSRHVPADPTRTDFVFTGWYEDREYQKPYDLENAVMPNRNLELYAKWEHKGATATFFDQNGGTALGVQNVKLGEAVRPPVNADPYFLEVGTSYVNLGVFRGWYQTLNNGLVVPYNFSNGIEKDVEIYGLYRTSGFKVVYDADGGTGTVPTDAETYKVNALAPVKNAALTKGTMILAGWQEKDKTGIIYYPGSTIKMYGNVNFEAVYANPNSLVNLVYHANHGGSAETITDTVIEGRTYALRDNQTFKRSGYALTGWSEIPGATTPQYSCGEGFLIPVGGTTLYATWEEVQYFTVTFVIRDADQHKGRITSQYEFRVEKGALSVQAIPVAVRPSVDIIPDADGEYKYRFIGWDALPVTIQRDLIVYANFEDLEKGGGTGTGNATVNNGSNGTENTAPPEQGLETPLLPGSPISGNPIVWLFLIAIAVFTFRRMRDRED